MKDKGVILSKSGRGGNTPTRILIVDEHPMVSDGLGLLLERSLDVRVVGTCGDVSGIRKKVGDCQPDLILLDVGIADSEGIDVTRFIRSEFPSIRVVVVAARFLLEDKAAAMAAGADDYLPKSAASPELIGSIHRIITSLPTPAKDGGDPAAPDVATPAPTPPAKKKSGLPMRESQVLRLLMKGLRNKEIASHLQLSVKTVETYRSRLMKRFSCTSVVDLVRHTLAHQHEFD